MIPIRMMDHMENQHPELPKRPATFYYYPEGSNDAKAFEDGVEKGEAQKLFGRHATAEGYFYGDADEEVQAETYLRKALMSTDKAEHLMPEKGSEMRFAGHTASGTEDVGGLLSLSLQDVHVSKEGQDSAMRQATFATVRDLKERYAPVDFDNMHKAVPEKLESLADVGDLVQTGAGVRHPVESALMPKMLD